MIIIANWKAYVEQPAKAKALIAAAKRQAAKTGVEIVLAPPAPLLGMCVGTKILKKEKVSFAAQDISNSTGGAATGDITAALLSNMGVRYTILGHSERRAKGETDEEISSKVQHAIAQSLIPIVCIGERTRDPEAQYLQFLRAQIASILTPLSPKERMRVVLAYEPIWAIGKSAAESISAHELNEMILYIRKILTDYFPGRAAEKVCVVYGGSVEPANIRDLARESDVDGFLVGHASVDVESFNGLVKGITA